MPPVRFSAAALSGVRRHFLLAAAVSVALLLAVVTPIGDPPDELDHLAAVRYFQQHAAPPPLGSDEVWYTAYGTSRVFNGEWSYWLLGRLSAAAAEVLPAAGEPRALRLWSVAALAATLAPLLYWPSRRFRLDLVALFVASVPQVLYVGSYVNGDAWTIAAATWVLRLGLAIWEQPEATLGLPFGVAIGLALGTKPNGWILMPFALAGAASGWRRAGSRRWRQAGLAALAATAVLAPQQLIQPTWSRAGSLVAAQRLEARLRHARPEFDPRRPTAPGYMLRARGVPLSDVALSSDWWRRTAGSAYALFGPMTRVPPRSLLALAALLWLALAALQVEHRWRAGPDPATAPVVGGAAIAVGALVTLALWYSWSYDYQPQGRYLLPAIAPLGLLLCGIEIERRRWRDGALAALLIVASAVVAWLVWSLAAPTVD